jgi:hypothetical protein
MKIHKFKCQLSINTWVYGFTLAISFWFILGVKLAPATSHILDIAVVWLLKLSTKTNYFQVNIFFLLASMNSVTTSDGERHN